MDAAFCLERAVKADNFKDIETELHNLSKRCEKLQDFIIRYSVNNLFMKFLIVDDEFVSRKNTGKILSKYGECDMALNGLEALNAVLKSAYYIWFYFCLFVSSLMHFLLVVFSIVVFILYILS